MPKPLYFTICSRNYMAYALTLGRSLNEADPDARFLIGLADDWDGDTAPANVEFEIVPMADIGLPTYADMTLRYSIMELNTAIKARFFSYLMEARGEGSVVYLDPDIRVLAPLHELETLLAGDVSCVLTPHSMEPLDDGMDPDDLRLMRTGCYNLGFLAMNRTREALDFLAWWERRLEVDCRVALNEGVFVDQKFMDLAPCYMDDVAIFRHPGYNLAYWNLPNRTVVRTSADSYLANGEPLRFVHFSGVTPGDPSVFSKHQNRYSAGDIGDLRPLLEDYLERLARNGHADWKKMSYAHDKVGGLQLDMWVRKVYARSYCTPLRGVNLSEQELVDLCNQPATMSGTPTLTRYFHEIWRAREDLKAEFDISSAAGRRAMCTWALTSGVEEYNPDDRFLEPLRADQSGLSPEHSNTTPSEAAAAGGWGLRRSLLPRLRVIALNFRPLYRRIPERILGPARKLFLEALHGGERAQLVSSLSADEPGVAVFGYFHAETGVGEGARRAFQALADADVPVEAHAIRASEAIHDGFPFDAARRNTASRKAVHLFHVNADETQLVVKRTPAASASGRPYRIGYWAWELEQLPAAMAESADLLDEIWTPSRFTAEAVSAAVSKPVYIIPHPAMVPAIPSAGEITRWRASLGLSQEDFVAYFSLDFNSYPARKNPAGVLDAFERAHAHNPDIKLILKMHGAGPDAALRRAIVERAEAMSGVHLIDGIVSRDSVDQMQWCSDVMMSLHRSEGFGLGLLEFMAKGLPVIATDYSGATDFIDDKVGVPVPFDLVDVKRGEYPFGEGQKWADPDINAASEALVELSRNRLLAQRLGAAGRSRVIKSYTPAAVASLISARLSEIGFHQSSSPEAAE